MTVEELRKEAKALGYNIIKINPKEKMIPCVCGCNRRERWTGNTEERNIILKCIRCGKEAYGKTDREARHNWNEMIKNEKGENING